jgi:hypothetical protein
MSRRRRRRFGPDSCSECTPAFSLGIISGARGCSSGTTSSRGRHFSLAWLLRNRGIVYIGNLVRAGSVSLALSASPVIELRRCPDVRGDRLSSELHVAMESVKLLSHVGSRLERT